MTTLIMTARSPTMGRASTPVSATWREIDGSLSSRGRSSVRAVAANALPTKVVRSIASRHAASPHLPTWMTSCRHRAVCRSCGSGLASSPPIKASNPACSERMPVSSKRSRASAHKSSAPGVSSASRPRRSTARAVCFARHGLRSRSAVASERMFSAPLSSSRSSYSSTVRAGAEAAAGAFMVESPVGTAQRSARCGAYAAIAAAR